MSNQRYTLFFFTVTLALALLNGCAMPAAPIGVPAGVPASSEGAAAAADASAERPHHPMTAPEPNRDRQYEPVTAGVTDDNEGWDDYLAYLNRHHGELYVHERDVSERYIIQVVDEHERAVHDAMVEVYYGDDVIFSGRTDAGGRVLFHPRALDSIRFVQRANYFRVVAQKGYVAKSATFARSGGDRWTLTLTAPPTAGRTQLDLLFLIDATGSMGDEIDKLKASMADVADQIAALPEQPDVRYGLVAYRDRGDEFVVRTYNFTYDLNQFQRTLSDLRADGGGDTPEALNEALHRSLNDLSWRSDETVRLIVLVGDAPPHLDYRWEHFSYDTDMIDAVRRGVKIFPVGASNLEADGEYIFRQLAQFTGGKFVFLTYAEGDDPSSGPGAETEHEVENYSVDTLDRLVVRLVRDELAKLSGPVLGAQMRAPQQQPSPMPTPTAEAPRTVMCSLDLEWDWNDCEQIGVITLLEQSGVQALLRVTLDGRHDGYTRARFDVTYYGNPHGVTVHIADSVSDTTYGGDEGDQSNDAEAVIDGRELAIYGNDETPVSATMDGHRLLFVQRDAAYDSATITLEVSNERLAYHTLAGDGVFESPYLFALARQPDHEGPVNHDIYAAFNRSVYGGYPGIGAHKIVVTLYSAGQE